MLKCRVAIIAVALFMLSPCVSFGAPETIEDIHNGIDLPAACDDRRGEGLVSLSAGWPTAVAVSPTTDHCWFAAHWYSCCCSWSNDPDFLIVHYPPKLVRRNLCGPCEVPVPPGRCGLSCDPPSGYIIPNIEVPNVHLGFRPPSAIAVSTTDGSVWVAEPGQIIRLDSTGAEMWRKWDNIVNPASISLDPQDGSCWVASTDANMLIHLNGWGDVMWSGSYSVPTSVSVNQTDSSVWVVANGTQEVVHLSDTGAELWRGSPMTYPFAVSVNSADGSCWVTDPVLNQVVHLSVQGAVLGSVYITDPRIVGVNSTHSDVWVGGSEGLFHYNADCSLRASYPAGGALSLAVNPRHNTVWVADTAGDMVRHLKPTCSPFEDVDCWHWAVDEIVGCYDADLVRGYDEIDNIGEHVNVYHPERAVTRDQMAVYIARALAGGDSNVPPPPFDMHFSDLLWTGWATKYIEYCYTQNVVQGYQDGTYGPLIPVNRAQMAVYIARSIANPHGEEGLADWPAPSTPTFADVPTGYWSYKHTEYCAAEGVVRGYLDGLYHPLDQVSRDQMAVYVFRAFDVPSRIASPQF